MTMTFEEVYAATPPIERAKFDPFEGWPEIDRSPESKETALWLHRLGGQGVPGARGVGMYGGVFPIVEVDELPDLADD